MIDITSDKYKKSYLEPLTDNEFAIYDWLDNHNGTTLEYALRCRKHGGWRFRELEVIMIMHSLVVKKWAIATEGKYYIKREENN